MIGGLSFLRKKTSKTTTTIVNGLVVHTTAAAVAVMKVAIGYPSFFWKKTTYLC